MIMRCICPCANKLSVLLEKLQAVMVFIRLKSHTPTFVDETLFGSRLEEPAFDAPWNNSNTESNLLGKHFFSPEAKQSSPITPRTLVTALDRPGSRLVSIAWQIWVLLLIYLKVALFDTGKPKIWVTQSQWRAEVWWCPGRLLDWMPPYQSLALSSGVWWSSLLEIRCLWCHNMTSYSGLQPTFWQSLLTQHAYLGMSGGPFRARLKTVDGNGNL